MKLVSIFLVGLFLGACTHTRLDRYGDILEPMVGLEKRTKIEKTLGQPVACEERLGLNRCEYRTASQLNEPVPIVFSRAPGFGPDLSPYHYFDVLYLYYDAFEVLQDWKPVVIR